MQFTEKNNFFHFLTMMSPLCAPASMRVGTRHAGTHGNRTHANNNSGFEVTPYFLVTSIRHLYVEKSDSAILSPSLVF